MPKLTKSKNPTDEFPESSGRILMTVASHLKSSLRSNLIMKLLILLVFLIFSIRRYYFKKVSITETIDGMEVPLGGDTYDLTID